MDLTSISAVGSSDPLGIRMAFVDLQKLPVVQWDADAVVAWLHQTHFGAFEKAFRDNEIDGPTLLKLSDSMVVRLLPTIKLEVQFLDLLQTLKQRHTTELNGKSTLPASSSTAISTNGHHHPHDRVAQPTAGPVMASSSSIENGLDHSSNSNSPIATTPNGHHHSRPRSTPKVGPSLKSVKREAKYLPNALLK